MTIEELYWLSGLLEGEGCFCLNHKSSLKIELAMNDLDVINKAKSITGHQNSIGVSRAKGSTAESYRIRWYGINAKNLAVELLPLMGNRRGNKIKEILSCDYIPIKWSTYIRSENERNWIAGFWEAEGSFKYRDYIDKRNNKRYATYSLSLSNSDKDVMERLASFLELPLYRKYPKSYIESGRKIQWSVNTESIENCLNIMLLIRDLVGERRKEKIDQILSLPVGAIWRRERELRSWGDN